MMKYILSLFVCVFMSFSVPAFADTMSMGSQNYQMPAKYMQMGDNYNRPGDMMRCDDSMMRGGEHGKWMGRGMQMNKYDRGAMQSRSFVYAITISMAWILMLLCIAVLWDKVMENNSKMRKGKK